MLLKRDPRQPRARRGSFPDRHRHRAAARHAQLRTARCAFDSQALSIDRPPRQSPRSPRARARRFLVEAGNARDRRGAGAACGVGGDVTRSRPPKRCGSGGCNLQTAYGQAMMWSKGFAAEETKAAFARAAEFAGPTEDASARLGAYYAQCLGAYAWRISAKREESLKPSCGRPRRGGRGTEAGAARRILGLICSTRAS